MRKSILVSFLIVLFSSQIAFADSGLPRDAITSMKSTIYALYVTADATCQTGLSALIPFQANPSVSDMTKNPDFGSVTPPSGGVNCMVVVLKNTLSQTWAAGSYTTMTGSSPDSQCNAGSTTAFTYPICRSVGTIPAPPAQVTADATAAGVTLATSCPASPTGNEVLIAYFSTNSACSGDQNSTTDPAACYANNAYPQSFAPPTSVGDTSHGLKLSSTVSTAAGLTLYMVIDPTGTIGGCGSVSANCIATSTGNCGAGGPPKFSFHN